MTPDLSDWGAVTALQPIAGGARRSVWRGRLNGREIVAKSPALPEPSLCWQLRVETLARRAGFDTPGLLPTRSGALASAGWTVEPFLAGAPLSPTAIPPLLLVRFHAACAGVPRRPGRRARRLPGRWDRLAAPRRPAGPVGVIHGDLHAGNLLRRPSGRIALLDWEEARIGPRLLDLAACKPGLPRALAAQMRSELAACATSEPHHAKRLARALLARNWP
ncbi:phosphotransferase [Jannaschia marina]|uniref:phosphotransferase n=1 Tax=Jannaschia marina TaxID=2741674 RepID=UPI0015CAB765|nr:phosphotransferase [Jannaschia marina]